AKLTGSKQPSIARIESGRHNPSLSYLKKIAEALDAKLDIRFIASIMIIDAMIAIQYIVNFPGV
ncbi:MAG: helix-turn-helix transcriptional regulator, partial [Bacteroidales bacterium]|nr:helix-turn-helix transcriptional regulator [Bacteroidales bacterium]